MTNLKEIEKRAMELNNDVEAVKKELKRVQSLKCNWAKRKFAPDYETKMTEIICEEQILKEVRSYIVGVKKTVTTFEQQDVDQLTYDETVKALKSIQSKKYHTRWLTDVEGDNDEFRNACRIEAMIKEHQAKVEPIESNVVRKSEIQRIIDTIESTGEISTEKILEMLKSLC